MKDIIYKLETSGLDPNTRHSVKKLECLLAQNFMEFGSSGNVYKKSDIIKWLPLEVPRQFFIANFSVLVLSSDVVLATYKLTSENISTLRSSI